MSAVHRPGRFHTDGEQLIVPVVPAPLPGRPPPAPPLPALPPLRLPTDSDPHALLLDMARLDRSGRVYAQALLDALNWPAGHRIDVAVISDALLIGSTTTGMHTAGSRGGIRLPAAARRMCGIDLGPPVLLVASLPQDLLIVHPARTIARLLVDHYAHLEGDRGDR